MNKTLIDRLNVAIRDAMTTHDGGPGSGHFGHKGVPGQRGGSSAASSGGAPEGKRKESRGAALAAGIAKHLEAGNRAAAEKLSNRYLAMTGGEEKGESVKHARTPIPMKGNIPPSWKITPTHGEVRAGNPGEMYDLAAKKQTQPHDWRDYAQVGEEEAKQIAEKTGMDVKGYLHTIEPDAILHALHQHEHDPRSGQLPITRSDIEAIPAIIAHPDNVKAAGKTDVGRDALRYQKRVNGHVFVVEEKRDKHARLALTTIYKYPAGGDSTKSASESKPPSHNVQNASSSPAGQLHSTTNAPTVNPPAATNVAKAPLHERVKSAVEVGMGKAATGPKDDADDTGGGNPGRTYADGDLGIHPHPGAASPKITALNAHIVNSELYKIGGRPRGEQMPDKVVPRSNVQNVPQSPATNDSTTQATTQAKNVKQIAQAIAQHHSMNKALIDRLNVAVRDAVVTHDGGPGSGVKGHTTARQPGTSHGVAKIQWRAEAGHPNLRGQVGTYYDKPNSFVLVHHTPNAPASPVYVQAGAYSSQPSRMANKTFPSQAEAHQYLQQVHGITHNFGAA